MSRIRGPYVRFCERDEAGLINLSHPTRFDLRAESIVVVSHASGDGKNFDAAGTSPAQGTGAFIDRTPGGHYIVNEQDSFSLKCLRQGYGKAVA